MRAQVIDEMYKTYSSNITECRKNYFVRFNLFNFNFLSEIFKESIQNDVLKGSIKYFLMYWKEILAVGWKI